MFGAYLQFNIFLMDRYQYVVAILSFLMSFKSALLGWNITTPVRFQVPFARNIIIFLASVNFDFYPIPPSSWNISYSHEFGSVSCSAFLFCRFQYLLPWIFFFVCFVLFFCYQGSRQATEPLTQIPGPFLAF